MLGYMAPSVSEPVEIIPYYSVFFFYCLLPVGCVPVMKHKAIFCNGKPVTFFPYLAAQIQVFKIAMFINIIEDADALEKKPVDSKAHPC